MAVEDAGEAARRLTFQLEMDTGFWFGAVVGNDGGARAALREVARRWCEGRGAHVSRAHGRRLSYCAVRPSRSPATSGRACTGFGWRRATSPGPWDRALTHALAAMNERREEYRRTLRGPLVVEGRMSLRRRLRELAPDLFSVAAFIAELGGAPSRAPEAPADDPVFEDILRAWRLRLDAPSAPPAVRVVAGGGVFRRVGVAVPADRLRHNTALLALHPGAPSREELEALLLEVLIPERAVDPRAYATVVHLGAAPAPTVVEFAQQNGVEIQGAREFRRVIDLRRYLEKQAEELRGNPDYDPDRYVPQRMTWRGDAESVATEEALVTVLDAPAALVTEDALAELSSRLETDAGKFTLILGDFGTGKTFLMRQLAVHLSGHSKLVPMLVNLRELNKSSDLEKLLASHLVSRGENHVRLDALRYMMESGDVVLLFDGFDELAFRVSYDAAADYLRTLCQAVVGRCRVVVSSRTQHFRNDDQAETALARELADVPRATYALEKFDLARVRRFVRYELQREVREDELEGAVEQRMDLMRDIKDLAGLAETPRMLAMILKIAVKDLQAVREKNRTITAAYLYTLLLDRWLEYEWVRSNPRGEAPGLSRPDREIFVERFARRVWLSREGAVSAEALREEVAEVARGARVDATEATHECGASTLLRRDAEGRHSFFHQSIMEFLIARVAAREVDATRTAPSTFSAGEISSLTAQFFLDMVGVDAAIQCARTMGALGEQARANSVRLLTLIGDDYMGSVDFSGEDLRAVDLSKFRNRLAGARLNGCNLSGVSLRGLALRDADLSGTDLRGADLADSDLGGACLRGADLTDAMLNRASLIASDLTGAVLRRTSLVDAKLHGAQCRDARFFQANLTGASFAGASLERAAVIRARVSPELDHQVELAGGVPSRPKRITAMLAGKMTEACVAVAPSRGLLALVANGKGRWIDLSAQTPSAPWTVPTTSLARLRSNRNGALLALISRAGEAWIGSASRGFAAVVGADSTAIRDVLLHPTSHEAVLLMADGRLLRARTDASRLQPLGTIARSGARFIAGAYSETGERFVAVTDTGECVTWETRLWSYIAATRSLANQSYKLVAISGDGSAVATLDEHGCSIGSVGKNALARLLPGVRAHEVVVNPTGDECAFLSESFVSVWSVGGLYERFTFGPLPNAPRRVVWARRSWMVVTDANAVTILSAASGTPFGSLSTFDDDAWVFCRADGRYRAVGDLRGRFWHQINDCRFEAGELDEVLDLRLRDDEPLLPPELFPPTVPPST
jgi:uncharacterized protein YjbI with pentapeptide repeats